MRRERARAEECFASADCTTEKLARCVYLCHQRHRPGRVASHPAESSAEAESVAEAGENHPRAGRRSTTQWVGDKAARFGPVNGLLESIRGADGKVGWNHEHVARPNGTTKHAVEVRTMIIPDLRFTISDCSEAVHAFSSSTGERFAAAFR